LKFIGTFILVFVVFAISDRHSTALHPGLIPLVIFMLILGIGAAFGMQTGTYDHSQDKLFSQSTLD
jgi:aquaglyceroporin related protein